MTKVGNQVYELALKVTSDADTKALDKTSDALSGIKKFAIGGAVFGGLAVGVRAATGALGGLTRQLMFYLQEGSRVEEATNKYGAVFKAQATEMDKMVEDISTRLQRSKYDVREWASTFQDTFVPLGFARDEAAKLSAQLTELSIDVASFYDTSEAEAAHRFQSALVGNTEAVRGYGIVLNEAATKQELLRMGYEGSYAAASNQLKVQARLNVITHSLRDAQGDAARTADSWANQQRKLSGIMRDFSADLGSKLLPVFSPVLKQFVEMADVTGPKIVAAFEDLAPLIAEAGSALATGIENIPQWIEYFTEGAKWISLQKEQAGYRAQAYDELIGNEPPDKELGRVGNGLLTFWENLVGVVQDYNVNQQNALAGAIGGATPQDLERRALELEASAKRETVSRQQALLQWQDYERFLLGRAVPAQQEAVDSTEELAQKAKEEAIALGENYRTQDSLFDQLEAAQKKEAESQGEWVRAKRDNTKEISEIDKQLAGDLSTEALKEVAKAYEEAAEGSNQWIAAYDQLEGDLSDQQRADLIREREKLLTTQGGEFDYYTGDTEKQKEAAEEIKKIQEQLQQSLRDIAVDAILAGDGLTQGTIQFLEGIGEIEEGAGKARYEFAVLAEEVDRLVNSEGFSESSIQVRVDAFNRLSEGISKSAESALRAATIIDEVNSVEITSQRQVEDIIKANIGTEIVKKAKLEVNTDEATTAIEGVENKLTELENTTYDPKLSASTVDAYNRLRQIEGLLENYDSRTYKATIDVEAGPNAKSLGLSLGAIWDRVTQQAPTTMGYGNRAFGGAMLPGMRYITSERGPELIETSGPATVYPHGSDRQRYGSGPAGVEMTNNFNFNSPSDLRSMRSDLLNEVEDTLRQAIQMVGM